MSSIADSNTPQRFFPRETKSDLRLLIPPLIVLMLNICHIDPAIQGYSLQEHVAEIIPPAQLFFAFVHTCSTIYNEIHDFLNRNVVNFPTRSSKLIINELAHGLYDSAHAKEAAIELSKDLLARGCPRRNTATEEQEESTPFACNHGEPA